MELTDGEERVWWRAYSQSIRNRRGSHPTTEAEAKVAKQAAADAVAEYRREVIG